VIRAFIGILPFATATSATFILIKGGAANN
jgi:hypothetical protein